MFVVIILLGTTSCTPRTGEGENLSKGEKIELYLPKLSDTYGSIYDHWKELDLEKISLMDKPLLGSEDIEYVDNKRLKIKKNFILVNGKGLESSLIYDNKKDGLLNFQYNGKEYSVQKKSPELFYNYTIYDICVVTMNDNIFLVKQKDFKKENSNSEYQIPERQYKKSIIGIPYVLVVDGKRTELGILKVDDADFEVPTIKDSWCYMGMPKGMPTRLPEGKVLTLEK